MTDDFSEIGFNDNDTMECCFTEETDKKYEIKRAPVIEETKIQYKKDGRPIIFDERTEEYYRALRVACQDPITHDKIDPTTGFKFEYQWDPYTGERLGKDPFGPLWFDPDILIKNFYIKRLQKLWVDPVDNDSGYFEGHYDDGEGAGEDFYCLRKEHHPEWYLFRLPVIDCYLTKDRMEQAITMGPKLTDAEIKEIDAKAAMQGNSYRAAYGFHRPSLVLMKQLYDQAIDSNPKIEGADRMSKEQLKAAQVQYNRAAIEKLKHMRG
jgi:hypothetical protein